ncbi:MAG TPA: hypothetical protein VHZ74_25045 [Bryobacteraceae bacterium]|nr:hypothetical protein [Bryobacteraceae bacterium]
MTPQQRVDIFSALRERAHPDAANHWDLRPNPTNAERVLKALRQFRFGRLIDLVTPATSVSFEQDRLE